MPNPRFPAPPVVRADRLRVALSQALPDFTSIEALSIGDELEVTAQHKTETTEVEIGRTPTRYDDEGNEIGGNEPITKAVPRPLRAGEHDAAIKAVIDKHDASTSEEETRPQKVRQKIDGAIAALENATRDKATWDGLTAAQRQEITRQALFAVAKLARLVLGRFDAAE